MMTESILKTIAKESPFSYEEIHTAYQRLWSIDAVMVAIEMALVTERELSEAIDIVCVRCRWKESLKNQQG